MATLLVTCRTCHSSKFRGDICPVCTSGKREQTMRVAKSQPISLARAHFFHAPAFGVRTAIARGDCR